MNGRTRRLLSDPYTGDFDLSQAFESLNLRPNNNNMADLIRIQEQLAQLLNANIELQQKVINLENSQATLRNNNAVMVTEYEDIVPTYTTGEGIQLDAFKEIPEFNGDKKVYRSWRSQVSTLMKQIETYKTHPRYAAALSIIRAKITGAASDILINNDTAHNIDAIIDRLDFSYADQRPLYVIEAEMTNIRQGGKSLQEFYDAINQALNMVLTKITMTYKERAEQTSLMTETQGKAIRTFVTGLNSALIRTTLYGSMPKSLAQAFAIAQTIQYDNQHLQLESKIAEQQRVIRRPGGDPNFNSNFKPNFNPNFRYQSQQTNQAPKQNNAVPPHYNQQQKSTPMEIDNSKQYIQRAQFSANNQPMKRERDPSFQYMNKQQRVNHVNESDDIQSVYFYDDSLENNCDEVADADYEHADSKQESIFLGE